jgi:hypothetical protein
MGSYEVWRAGSRIFGGCVIAIVAIAVCSSAPASAQTGVPPVTVVSLDSGGAPANGASGQRAAMSADARFIAFTSAATNLVAGDTNGSIDVFVKDRQTGAVTRVSVAQDGTERSGDSGLDGVAISADGNVVAFTSRAALVAADTNTCNLPPGNGNGPSCTDIYVFTRGTNTIVLASRGVDGVAVPANGPSRDPALSGDGATLVFTSDATNLVHADTNGLPDIFRWNAAAPDALARVSIATSGAQSLAASSLPLISDDGQVIAFVSGATSLGDAPETIGCMDPICPRGFMRVGDLTFRLPAAAGSAQPGDVTSVAISGGGRYVGVSVTSQIAFFAYGSKAILYDRVSGDVSSPGGGGGYSPIFLSGDGRFVGMGLGFIRPGYPLGGGNYFDRHLGVTEALPFPLGGHGPTGQLLDVSADGRFVLINSTDSFGASDTNATADAAIVDFDDDVDDDGMTNRWETWFGLDPTSAADAGADPDGDGLTNLQEYQTNGHPKGTFKRYFAEGATGTFFTTQFAAMNPGDADARLLVRYLGSDGGTGSRLVFLAPLTSFAWTTQPGEVPENFSTVIESDRPFVADRSMHWGTGIGAGSHGEGSIEAPSTTWYLAEGATHGAFDLFYLFQNPNEEAVNVTVEYLRPAPAPPIVRGYPVAAHSRYTLPVDGQGPELEATDVSAKITADRPIIVERAMYYSRPEAPFAAGHDGAGVTAPSTHWFLAEGATGSFFDLYVLIANPGDTIAQLEVSYLRPDGAAPVVKFYDVAPRSRRTISVDTEDPLLADTAVSTIVTSTNGQPVVVERAMWWPGGNWYEAHLSAGATTTGTRWAFAEGEVKNDVDRQDFVDTYVLIANTSDRDGVATLTFAPDWTVLGPLAPIQVNLPRRSRVNVRLGDILPSVGGTKAGVIVESDGVEIVVERAQYRSTGGVTWTAGHAALATKLQ